MFALLINNFHLIIGILNTLIFLIVAWINFKSRQEANQSRAGILALGFLALAIWSILSTVSYSAVWLQITTTAILFVGALVILASYLPKNSLEDSKPSNIVSKNEQRPRVPGGPSKLENKLSVVPPQVNQTNNIPLSRTFPKPFTKPSAPKPTSKEKVGLRSKPLIKIPPDHRKKPRSIISIVIIFLFIVSLVAFAYFIYTLIIKPEEPLTSDSQPSSEFVEATEPTSEPTSLPVTTQEPSPEPVVVKETVTIKETETGFLNVRDGASTATPIITKIDPGDTFTLLEEGEEGLWFKLQIDDETAGWVSSKYTTKN